MKLLLLFARTALALAALLGVYLGFAGLSLVPACSAPACETALASRYATLFGVPVGFPGAALAALAFLAAPNLARRVRGGSALTGGVASFLLVAFGVWFIAVQAGVLGVFCALCTLFHVLSTGGVAIVWVAAKTSGAEPNPRGFAFSTSAAAAAFAVALLGFAHDHQGGEGGRADAASGASPAAGGAMRVDLPSRRVSLFGGKLGADLSHLPTIGSIAAEHVAFALVDPTSDRCLTLPALLENAQANLGGGVAIALVPASPTAEAEAVQRTLLAAWHRDRLAYKKLADALALRDLHPRHSDVEASARQLLGEAALLDTYAQCAGEIDAAIAFGKRLHRFNEAASGSAALPQLVVGDDLLFGSPESPEAFASLVRSKLGVHAASAASDADALPPLLELVGAPVTELGPLAEGESKQFELEIRNAGGGELALGWFKLPPGCRVVEMPTEAIRAGGSETVRIEVTAPAAAGRVDWSLTLHHDGPGSPFQTQVIATVGERPGTPGAVTDAGPREP